MVDHAPADNKVRRRVSAKIPTKDLQDASMADNPHTLLVRAIERCLKQRMDCRVWVNNTGSARRGNQFIKFGYKGSPDIIGFTSDGKFLGIEVKTGQTNQSKEQKFFQWRMNAFNARYYLVRDKMDDLIATLDALKLPIPILTLKDL